MQRLRLANKQVQIGERGYVALPATAVSPTRTRPVAFPFFPPSPPSNERS